MLSSFISMATLSESCLTTNNLSDITYSPPHQRDGKPWWGRPCSVFLSWRKTLHAGSHTSVCSCTLKNGSQPEQETKQQSQTKTGTNLESKLLVESRARGQLLVGREPLSWDASCDGASLEGRSS